MELVQYYDDGRQTSATDLYANVLGTVLGAIGGRLTGRNFRWPLLRGIGSNRIPTLLLGSWAGYRLFPYVPTIDLHKYWNALKRVVLHPNLTGYDLFRYTAIWLTIGALIEAIGGPRRLALLFPLFVGSVIVAKVVMVDTTLTTAVLAGAGLAFGAWDGSRSRCRSPRCPDCSTLLRLCHRRVARSVPVRRYSEFFRTDPVPRLHVQLSRDRCFIIFSKILPFRQLDLAPGQSRASASVIDPCRRGYLVHDQ
jgi:hypothetical protein